MRKIISMLLLGASTFAGLAQGFVYFPANAPDVEGNSSSSALFNTSGSQLLQVYSASAFGIPTGASGLVSSVSFRMDGASGQSFSGFLPSTIILAYTPNSPDSLSPVYSGNGQFGSVVAYNSSFPTRATNTLSFPRSFEVQIPFTTPFWYDPSRGNLSMYIGTLGGPANLFLDLQDTAGDGIGRVYGPDGSATGIVDSGGFVTRFGMTVVPEPRTTFLLILGCIIAVTILPRRKPRTPNCQ